MVKIILFGSPGVGKGTQAELLLKKLKIPIISPGEIFREAARNGTKLGIKAKEKYWEKGHLVPDEITIGIMKERLQKGDCKSGFILDGFPRTILQARALDKIAKMDYIFNIRVGKEELVQRMAARRICSCGAWFNMRIKPPKNDERCDACGKELLRREDDEPEIVEKRFEVYNKQTKPLLDYYTSKVIDIDGEQSIEEVHGQISGFFK